MRKSSGLRISILSGILLATGFWIGRFTQNHPQSQMPNLVQCAPCKKVLPGARFFTLYNTDHKIFVGYAQEPSKTATPPEGFIFNTKDFAPGIRGYGGPIEFMVGIDSKGTILGITCLAHNETSSYIGDIDHFLKQFIGKNAQDPLTLKQDIDGITGATITSESSSRIIRESLAIVSKTIFHKPYPQENEETSTSPSEISKIKEKLKEAGLTPMDAKYGKISSP